MGEDHYQHGDNITGGPQRLKSNEWRLVCVPINQKWLIRDHALQQAVGDMDTI